MDDFLGRELKAIEEKISIEPLPVRHEVETIKLPLGLITIRCYNWKADGIRKIYFMRLKSVFSFLDIAGTSIYPEPCLDIPIFNCDFNGMGKNVVPIINFVSLFDEPAYREKYIKPMEAVYERYKHLPRLQPSDFMKTHLAPYCTFARVKKNLIEEVLQCGIDYLNLYLVILIKAEKNEDPSFQEKVKKAQDHYINDLVTKDPSRKMLGKIIGKERAERIFHEVLT